MSGRARGSVFQRLLGADFDAQLRAFEFRPRVEVRGLQPRQWRGVAEVLADPLRYYLQLPAKRVRPALLQLAADLLGLAPPALPWLKCYVETLHNASLVLDDIQDGSALRRGQPCAHVRLGLDRAATAAVSALAVDCEACLLARLDVPPGLELALRRLHARTLEQLLVGVALDVRWHGHTAERPAPSLPDYLAMVRLKTAALMTGGVRMLALWAPPGDPRLAAVRRAFTLYALAFQVHDDLLNIEEGPYQDLKGLGEDIHEGKLSYVVVRMSGEEPRSADCARLLEILDGERKDDASIAEALRILRASPYVAEGRALCRKLAGESRLLLRDTFPREQRALQDWEEVLETSFGLADRA